MDDRAPAVSVSTVDPVVPLRNRDTVTGGAHPTNPIRTCPPPGKKKSHTLALSKMMNDHGHSSCYSSPGYYLPIEQKDQKREKRKYRCRKRSPATIERARVVRRDKANARERRRMNSLNDALEELRNILPQLPDEPKMTKIETLRVAQGYIKMLSEMLTKEGSSEPDSLPNSHCHSLPDLQMHHYYSQYSSN